MKTIIRLFLKYRIDLFFSAHLLYLRILFRHAYISRYVKIVFERRNQLKIGKNTGISSFTTIIVANDPNSNLNNSQLSIGENCYIGEFNNIRAGGGSISIGNNCLISQHITIVASNHSINKGKNINTQPWNLSNNFVVIKDDVWIGANSVILPGVTIGYGAIVGAGSIVTKNVPDYAVVYGNPARIINYRS